MCKKAELVAIRQQSEKQFFARFPLGKSLKNFFFIKSPFGKSLKFFFSSNLHLAKA
jgi:hypothetical protein